MAATLAKPLPTAAVSLFSSRYGARRKAEDMANFYKHHVRAASGSTAVGDDSVLWLFGTVGASNNCQIACNLSFGVVDTAVNQLPLTACCSHTWAPKSAKTFLSKLNYENQNTIVSTIIFQYLQL